MPEKTRPLRLAMFASGSGTNVGNFIQYFSKHKGITIALVVSSNPEATVLNRAAKAGIPHLALRRDQWTDPELVLGLMKENSIDMIVLAGFLLLVPGFLIDAFPGKILNIHPALLPKYGGKGMYGMRVHKAVIENAEKKSGISIHLVNERYDEGEVLFQAEIPVAKNDTPQSLAEKVHKLEYEHYPKVVEQLAEKRIKS